MKIAIIGAGMAGLYLCEYLHQSASLTIFHDEQAGMASRGQSFLFHPFPGRSLEIVSHLEEAVRETTLLLTSWRSRFPHLIRLQPMLRYFKGTNGSRLEKSYQRWWKNATQNWVQCTEHKKGIFKQQSPFYLPYPGITYSPAAVIDFDELRQELCREYQQKGCTFVLSSVQSIRSFGDKWLVDGCQTPFDQVVLALGTATRSWFPALQLTTQGGSLLRLQMKPRAAHLFSLDGLHIGAHHSGDWVIGSTRWHHLPSPDAEILQLKKKLLELFPSLEQGALHSLWSGRRCIYPADRMPLCGELPHQKGIQVLTALGSKGMLWGPFSAKKLSQSILYQTPIPPNINLLRANQEDGWFSEKIS